MITVLNYGMGNLGSIKNAISRIGEEVLVTDNPEEIVTARKIILPGVGSFDQGIIRLNESGFVKPLIDAVIKNDTPILGICLGMQLLTESSEEGKQRGLGWIKGHTVRFDQSLMKERVRIPHIGWNTMSVHNEANSLLSGITEKDRLYFAHSYHVSNIDDEITSASTWYGYSFPSVIQKGMIFGIQCHPERSHQAGLKILKNFVGL